MGRLKELSTREWLVKKVSQDMGIAVKDVDAVIGHQFEEAKQAMALPTCNSIEFSGFGKFIFKPRRAEWKLKKSRELVMLYTKVSEDEDAPMGRRVICRHKLNAALKHVEYLKAKLGV